MQAALQELDGRQKEMSGNFGSSLSHTDMSGILFFYIYIIYLNNYIYYIFKYLNI